LDLNTPEAKAAIEEAAKKIAKEQFDKEAGGLKAKNEELLDELKGLKKKFDGIDPEEYAKLKTAKRDKEDKDSDPVQLRQRIEAEFAPKLDAEKKRGDTAESKLKEHIIDSGLTSALLEAGVAKEFLPAAKALLQSSKKVDVTDSGAVVDGKPVADFAKSWAAGDGKPFISAPDNNGGGAKGGNGGGAATGKKIKDMTAAEKAAAMKEMGHDKYLEQSRNEMKA
jgi:hypothetical protein